MLEASVVTHQGGRRYMEDVVHVQVLNKEELPEHVTYSFYAVFDGHGGDVCAKFSANTFAAKILMEKAFPEDIPEAMTQALHKTDQEFAKKYPKMWDDGCTCISSVVRSVEGVPHEAWVCNSGDSRCIAVEETEDKDYTALVLSEDHKPSRPDEKARIEKQGGIVRQASMMGLVGPHRVYNKDNCGGLAISRGLGDLLLKKNSLVIVDPDIVHYEVKGNSVGLVLASDGLWDGFTNNTVAKRIGAIYQEERQEPKSVLEALVNDIIAENKACDNISVIFVPFRQPADT